MLVHICSVAFGTLSYQITNILIKHVSAVEEMINLLWQFICLLRPGTHLCTLINQKQSGISSTNSFLSLLAIYNIIHQAKVIYTKHCVKIPNIKSTKNY